MAFRPLIVPIMSRFPAELKQKKGKQMSKIEDTIRSEAQSTIIHIEATSLKRKRQCQPSRNG
jgi:hypothetical protein